MLKRAPEILHGSQSWKWYWRFIRDPMECISAAHDRFGDICAFEHPLRFIGDSKRYVLALSSEANRQVLGQPDVFRPGGQVVTGPKGSAHQRMRTGIIAMHGDKHRRHRRIMMPPFAKQAVASYANTMAELTDRFLDKWEVGKPLDMFEEMSTLSNWIAARILFDHEDYVTSIEMSRLITHWIALDINARKFILQLDLPGSAYRRLLRHADVLEKAMLGLIEHKRREEVPGSDVLSILVRATDSDGFAMSDTDLTAHAVILHAAAFMTTASALAWTIYLIAQNPGIAAQLDDEIHGNLTGWPPEGDKLDALPVLDGVIKESLRLFPPVHHTIRTATKPTELSGVPLKRGDKVILSGFITHRNPEIFDNPDRFDPSRWSRTKPGPYDYIPFGGGPRLCLGYAFAMQEMKLIVARIMQRYRLAVVPGSRIDAAYRLTLSPKSGIPMTIHARGGAYAAGPVTGNIAKLVEHG